MLKQFVGLTSPKLKNLKLLYSLVRKLGPVSINTLAEMTGYKNVTCARLLEELVHAGLIYDSGIGESSGGRRPLMYVIQPEACYLIGVEITSLYTTVLLLDLKLNILDTAKLQMDSRCTGEYTLMFVSGCVLNFMNQHNIRTEQLLGIGVGVLDPIDREHGILRKAHLFPAEGWEELPVVEMLGRLTNIRVFLDNGTNLAALAEYRNHYWQTSDNLVFVSSDIGIRCGMIVQGRMVRSRTEMDDAFGHMIVDIHGHRCSCGSYGCLQAYSSLPAIRDEVIRRIKRGHVSMLQDGISDIQEIGFHHVLSALEQEDSLCLEVIRDAAYYFGIGLSNLVFLLRPDVVVFGGTLVPKPLFYEVASATAQSRLSHYPNHSIQLHESSEAYNIVAQGAGCMVLDHFTEDL
ncbi:ROK family protein [Paenibacillus sp. Z6-24]